MTKAPPLKILYVREMNFTTIPTDGGRLLAHLTSAEGEQAVIGLDTAAVQDLLLALAQGLARPDSPPSFRALVQWLSPREVRVGLHGSATPTIRQELEAGVSTTTTLDIAALTQLRDDCETVLRALPPPTKNH